VSTEYKKDGKIGGRNQKFTENLLESMEEEEEDQTTQRNNS
jgi:hypothetical protein